ncbi:hypothetical protein GJ496_000999 [Pomphorhynchus laevis]|nr:hypothetical protein GJ496_000999 [Pomphorhynchus laevis]
MMRGTLLAVGCNDGKVLIWDFLTRGVAKVLTCHIWPICSLSWSRDSHLLLTACADNTACIWKVLSGECIQRYRFSSALIKVQFSPRNSSLILVVPLKQIPMVINRELNVEQNLLVDDEIDTYSIANFDRRGQYIFIGTSGGKLHLVETSAFQVIRSVHINGISTTGAIKQIEFSRRGNSLLLNASDRMIRLFEMDDFLEGDATEVTARQKLQDLVNKTTWRKCCFSGDGEYVCASSAKQHNVYIWEKLNGTLVQILSGTKGETLVDVVWHPIRPIIISIANGVVHIWSQNQIENWSAFAPDFRELDENVEYEERESEFDDEDEDRTPPPETSAAECEDTVEVCVADSIPAFLSSDEECEDPNQLLFIPAVPDIDDPEDVNPEIADLSEDDINSQQTDSTGFKTSTSSRKQNESPSHPLNSKDINFVFTDVKEQHPLLQNIAASPGNSDYSSSELLSKRHSSCEQQMEFANQQKKGILSTRGKSRSSVSSVTSSPSDSAKECISSKKLKK